MTQHKEPASQPARMKTLLLYTVNNSTTHLTPTQGIYSHNQQHNICSTHLCFFNTLNASSCPDHSNTYSSSSSSNVSGGVCVCNKQSNKLLQNQGTVVKKHLPWLCTPGNRSQHEQLRQRQQQQWHVQWQRQRRHRQPPRHTSTPFASHSAVPAAALSSCFPSLATSGPGRWLQHQHLHTCSHACMCVLIHASVCCVFVPGGGGCVIEPGDAGSNSCAVPVSDQKAESQRQLNGCCCHWIMSILSVSFRVPSIGSLIAALLLAQHSSAAARHTGRGLGTITSSHHLLKELIEALAVPSI
jgi:hypothetical protein